MASEFKAGNLSFSIFGESHGKAIGVVIQGIPGGITLDFDKILEYTASRAPKADGTSTARSETDFPHIVSGVVDNVTTGTPICCVICNKDQRSNDYKSVSHLARPGHADYTGYIRYNGANDLRGGGHFSGRITAPLVFAGAVADQILLQKGIVTGAHIKAIGEVKDQSFDPVNVDKEQLLRVRSRYLPLIDTANDQLMRNVITGAFNNLDSVGGIIECCTLGMPVGVGSPMFDGLENRISQLVFGVPAVKGIEFGVGFEAAALFGSENNDEFYIDHKEIKTRTNNHGGILGGISSGMPIILRVAIKPTPSISRPQNTVDYTTMTEEVLQIKGRHDPCIVPRAVPCIESAVNLALLSFLI